MADRMQGKVAFVTGGGSGIGAAMSPSSASIDRPSRAGGGRWKAMAACEKVLLVIRVVPSDLGR